ncbi:MAG: N-acetyl-gamma-glutamyl-phosphate reductase [Desulfobacteraceae bacterium]|jgi:N-acetyl-gamma-glutamyl-phosphate reductase
MIRVGVIGATGYAGAELIRILSGHPEVKITCITSRQYAGQRFDAVYPSMKGWVDLVCENYAADKMSETADIVFTALPHQLPMAIVPELLQSGLKVIDLSADFRFKDVKAYEGHYQPHTAPDLAAQAVYGLSEIYTREIGKARLVGNPGCYPTSVLLPLIPLIRENLIEADGIIADAKSGVSGAGRGATLTTHYCQVNESFKAYKVGGHRHKPEMAAILTEQAGYPVDLTFVPHLVPMSRGMATTIYTRIRDGVGDEEIDTCLRECYTDRPFVRRVGHGVPDSLNVKGTNCCDIGFYLDGPKRQLILMSVIDNLVKGAAGQAVQNMNLMMGLDETAGLMYTPYPI